MMPKMPDGSFAKKLYSLYLTYLPAENLVTVMTCNEIFNPERPDTFFEPV